MDLPNEKSQKYDRQLRLWGDHGQSLLEGCKLCLVNATATGCEILKNLILPGIGSFTIIDEQNVTEEDLGNNFFLTMESLGKKRGQEAMRNLKELNEEVTGDFREESLEEIMERNPEVFLNYNIVVATGLPLRSLLKLSKYLWSHDIPLIVCQSYGMIGYLRLVVNNHTVIESHAEHPRPDLRLVKPFPELVEFCDSFNLETLTKAEHCHVPWLVLLYKYLQLYKDKHDGEVPKLYKEKTELKNMINKGIRHNEHGVPEDEENFEEACKGLNTALPDVTVPSELQDILDHPHTTDINNDSRRFWIMSQALKRFIELEGTLPLQGSIPDMTADSKSYISLQRVYRDKAHEHAAKVHQFACEIMEATQGPSEGVSLDDVHLFCKNASNLALVNCRSLECELDPKSMNAELLASRLDDDGGEVDDSIYYVLLRASEEFYSQYSRFPGWYDDQVEADIPLLKSITTKYLNEAGLTLNLREDYIHDFCSFGGAEIHTIASYMGGVAAQETIKIITRQYVPINNTYLYNGASQTSTILQL